MSALPQSDSLKRLVLFIIAVAVLGTLLALAWYFAVDLPIQKAAALNVPTNVLCWPKCPY
jgi:hypothetical protein